MELQPQSVCDVGTGWGEFPKALHEAGVPYVMGVDFALPVEGPAATYDDGGTLAMRNAPAHALPIADNGVEWITALDVLEHLLPEEVDVVLREFGRCASKGFIFSICYHESCNKVHGEGLHPTVKPEVWWIERINAVTGASVAVRGRFLFCFLDESAYV